MVRLSRERRLKEGTEKECKFKEGTEEEVKADEAWLQELDKERLEDLRRWRDEPHMEGHGRPGTGRKEEKYPWDYSIWGYPYLAPDSVHGYAFVNGY